MIKATFGFLALALGGALAFGCGGSDSGGTPTRAEFISICKRFCAKSTDCAGVDSSVCSNLCDTQADSAYKDGKPAADCDFNKVKAKIDECLKAECSELETCSSEIGDVCPALNDEGDGSGGATGAGGSTGDGGSTSGTGGKTSGTGGKTSGTGGSTSGGSCDSCTKAEQCCREVSADDPEADPNDCAGMKAQCEEVDGSDQSLFIQLCQSTITGSQALGYCK